MTLPHRLPRERGQAGAGRALPVGAWGRSPHIRKNPGRVGGVPRAARARPRPARSPRPRGRASPRLRSFHAGEWGAQPPAEKKIRGGWVGCRAQRALVRGPRGHPGREGARGPRPAELPPEGVGGAAPHRRRNPGRVGGVPRAARARPRPTRSPRPRGRASPRPAELPRGGVGGAAPRREENPGRRGSRAQRALIRRPRRHPTREGARARACAASTRGSGGRSPPQRRESGAGGWGAARSARSSEPASAPRLRGRASRRRRP